MATVISLEALTLPELGYLQADGPEPDHARALHLSGSFSPL